MSKRNKRVCPVERASGLDNLFRKWIHNPDKILGDYIKEGMVVLDVGCGPGFFSVEIAKMVGKSGKVIAVDLQEGMLEKLKNKIQGSEIEKRIELHKCETDKIGISTNLDFVLAFYMVHEVPDLETFLEEIQSILKPDGTFFIIEPSFHVSKQAFEETIDKAVAIGFKHIKRPRVFLSRAAVLRK
ncbi:putative arsenite methyltransferase [ANME-1 cluster archaeon GoMg2]|nr:putative arsenite methyltransferase [ANME-1 cluster archaeon GoMg2]